MEPTSIAARPDEVRATLHRAWARVSPSWAEHAEYVDGRAAPLTARMLEIAAPRPGERLLELACGAGGTGLAAAASVLPDGEVVVSDVAAEMTSIAARRAEARGLGHVRARVLDLERIDEPAASFDVVLCREGLMFALDPAAAAGEIARVLRPGGRAAVAVWGPRERNPWLGLVFDAVAAGLGRPVPPPGIPGPFALQDGDRLAGLLVDAGLGGVAVEEVPVPLRAASFAEWWARTAALAGPLASILDALPDEKRRELAGRLRQAVQPYETHAGLEFPGVAMLATARRGSALPV